MPDPTGSLLRWREIPRSVWAIGCVSMLMDVSSEMIHALLPLYLVTVFGVSMLAVGVIEGVAEAIAQIVRIFSGALSDRLGKRKLLAVVGYGLAALTKPAFPLATGIGWIVAARFVDRLGKGIRGAPRDALVADLAPPDMRGASFGLRQSLDTIGAFVGPILAIVLMAATASQFAIVFWIAALPAFLSVAVLIVAVQEPQRPVGAERVRAPLSPRELSRLPRRYWAVVAVAATFTLARFSEAFLVLRAESIGLSLALAPVVLVVMNVFYALSAWPAGALSDRIGRYATAMIGFVLLILANLALAFGAGPAAIGMGAALWGLHMGFTQGLFAALVADTAPADLRGTAFGMLHLVTGVATVAASIVAGALWDQVGPAGTFIAGAAFTAVALLALPLGRRLARPRQTR